MSFKYSVIGDNTPENREHLGNIGIKSLCGVEGNIIIVHNGNYVCVTIEGEIGNNFFDSINCIGNPQLFKAVSAMRSDSDYMQWFTCKVKDGLGNELPDSWVLCTQKTLQDFGWVNNSPNTYGKNTPYHKATLSELEAHFQRV